MLYQTKKDSIRVIYFNSTYRVTKLHMAEDSLPAAQL
jgi:hypothetical protein